MLTKRCYDCGQVKRVELFDTDRKRSDPQAKRSALHPVQGVPPPAPKPRRLRHRPQPRAARAGPPPS